MTTCRCTAPKGPSAGWDCQPDPGAARAGRRSSASVTSTAAASVWLHWSRQPSRHRHGSPANGHRSSRRHGCSRPPQGSTSLTVGCVTGSATTSPTSRGTRPASHHHGVTTTPPVTSVAPSGVGTTSVDCVPVLAWVVVAVKDRRPSVPEAAVPRLPPVGLGLARCPHRQRAPSCPTSPLASSLEPSEGAEDGSRLSGGVERGCASLR